MRRRKFGGDGGRDGGYKIGEDCNGDETFFSFFFCSPLRLFRN